MGQANTKINQQTQKEPGYHELEVLELCDVDEETHLLQKRDGCNKNPGHEKFMPVGKFNIEHLPEGYRNQLYIDYIMAVISLTVRLVVRYVSCDRPRPSRLPLRKIYYPLSLYRGQHVSTFGSGRVRWVRRNFTDMDGESCPCPHCKKLDDKDRKKQWGKFGVITAKHVVFDSEESRHTQVDVDYNTDTDRDTCPKLHGVEVVDSNIEIDECLMYVVSHNSDVCLMLEERVRHYEDLRDKLKKKYREYRDFNNLPIFCVSHPHGMSKHVSVGEYRGRQEGLPRKWRYTTSTCPGSSGSPIHRLGDVVGDDLGYSTHHSGCNKDHGLNESGSWGYWFL